METETLHRNSYGIRFLKHFSKRRIHINVRKLHYFWCMVGIIFLCFYVIYKMKNLKIKTKRDNGTFTPLCNDLKFDDPSERFEVSFQFNEPGIEAERKFWHNLEAISNDKKRKGPGEQGAPTNNTDESKKELEKQLVNENHFNGLLSNLISVNRSVPSYPLMAKCLLKEYLSKLPVVSIVIPCRNEFYSVLQRTLHSIVNRTPKELLKEIIIVDDHSYRGYSVSEMEFYAEQHFPNLVKFVRLPKRMGLMNVRMAGAKVATGDVLVFLDSHIECNHNWLPPLLEPIAINDRISTTPIIDIIDFITFEYKVMFAWRGIFDWDLSYIEFYLRTGPNIDETRPYKDGIMMGGLFAISRRFFWQLGGYDAGLDTWGGEHLELSFKIWMCGGMLLTVPCSHVGHIYIVPHSNKVSPTNAFSIWTNFKRVVEVWMDDYKHFVYDAHPEVYNSIDAGDLSEQHALRNRLKCKSFKWFRNFVAPDVPKHPYELPADFANGTLQSLAFKNYCLDTFGLSPVAKVHIFECAGNLKKPHLNQLWNFNFRHEIKNFHLRSCLDVFEATSNATVFTYNCHGEGKNQFWQYDKNRNWLVHNENGTRCLETIQVEGKFRVVVNECDDKNVRMRWIFGYVNTISTPFKFRSDLGT